MLIFLLGGQSAADMTLRLVDVQNHPGLGRQGGIDVGEAVGDVFMFRRYYLELFYFHIRLTLKYFHLIPNHLIVEGKYPHFHLCLLLFS